MPNYHPQAVEPKWQRFWEERQFFHAPKTSPKSKLYLLEMLPYPSGDLHMGHMRNYTIGDAVARYKRARGMNVFHPIGWDAFGLPAENAAIERKIHPREWTLQNIARMKEQLRRFGFSYALVYGCALNAKAVKEVIGFGVHVGGQSFCCCLTFD